MNITNLFPNWLLVRRTVWLCFAEQDRNAVDAFLAAFDSDPRFRCIDPQTEDGLNSPEDVRRRVRRSCALLLFSSKEAAYSGQVREELQFARDARVPVIDLRITADTVTPEGTTAANVIPADLTPEEQAQQLRDVIGERMTSTKKRGVIAGTIVAALLILTGLLVFGGEEKFIEGPRVEVRGSVTLEGLPERIVPGQLVDGHLRSVVRSVTPEEIRDDVRIYFALETDAGDIIEEGYLPEDNSGDAIESLAERVKEKLAAARTARVRLRLGLGLQARNGEPEVRPHPSDITEYRIGFPLPSGCTYPVADHPDQRDTLGAWYATVRREADGALVSVFFQNGEWFYVDQEQVSSEQYRQLLSDPELSRDIEQTLKEFPLPFPVPFMTQAALNTAGRSTEQIQSAADLAVALRKPLFGLENDLYPPAYLSRRFHLPVAVRGSIADLPAVGLCALEAVAYRNAMRRRSGTAWRLTSEELLGLFPVVDVQFSSIEGSIWPTRHAFGSGPRGTFFLWTAGNLHEFGTPTSNTSDAAPSFGASWKRGPSEIDTVPATRRTIDHGIRLYFTLPDEG